MKTILCFWKGTKKEIFTKILLNKMKKYKDWIKQCQYLEEFASQGAFLKINSYIYFKFKETKMKRLQIIDGLNRMANNSNWKFPIQRNCVSFKAQ